MLEEKTKEILFGLYLPFDFSDSIKVLLSYERKLGIKPKIASFYFSWGENKDPDINGIESILREGFIPMITWEPWHLPENEQERLSPHDQPDFSLNEIIKGRYDEYIMRWAKELKVLSQPIFFRPMHEMNGNWYPWCGTVSGNEPGKFIDAWCHIRSLFRSVGNNQLIWVWSPYAHSVPDLIGNEIQAYYPGHREVDWLALDGYNWGKSRIWSRWQSFKDIFNKGYDILCKISEEKPIMIGEIGCTEEGGSKADWILDLFEKLKTEFSRVKVLVWFNVNKECDWRIESSEKAIKSFSKGLKIWFT